MENIMTMPSSPIHALTADQMVEVDRAMIEDYHIELIQMMENAGRSFAELARRQLRGAVAGSSVVVLCGTGNNGGGGMTAARRLHNWGTNITVVLTKSKEDLSGIPAHQLEILQRMKIPILEPNSPLPLTCDLILDSFIGYNLSGSPRGTAANLIQWANAQAAPIFALDTPSGLDITSGTAHEPTIRAAATLTLALPKQGLLVPNAKKFVGDLYLADISVPPEIYTTMGIQIPNLFEREDIIRIA